MQENKDQHGILTLLLCLDTIPLISVGGVVSTVQRVRNRFSSSREESRSVFGRRTVNLREECERGLAGGGVFDKKGELTESERGDVPLQRKNSSSYSRAWAQ